MKLLTLTPEVHAYAVAVLACSCLSAGEITALLRHWLGRRQGLFLTRYIIVMAVISLFALLVLNLPGLASWFSWPSFALSLPLGILAGGLAWQGELIIKLSLLRRSLRQRADKSSPARREWGARSAWSAAGRESGESVMYRTGWSGQELPAPGGLQFLILMLAAGGFEEILYRGVLVQLIQGLKSPGLIIICLSFTAAMFALSHLRLGYGEVLAKLPLSLLTLSVALLMGSVLPALFAHLVFNFKACQAMTSGNAWKAISW